jgi:multidrug efflux pump
LPSPAWCSTSVPSDDCFGCRFNNFTAAKITGDAAEGYSSGQALDAMEALAREVLPQGFSFAWSGQSYEERKAGSTAGMVFASRS